MSYCNLNGEDSLYRLRKINCGILLLTNPNILVFSLSHFPLFIKYYLLLKVSLKLYLFKKHWLIDIPFPKGSHHPHLNSDCSCFFLSMCPFILRSLLLLANFHMHVSSVNRKNIKTGHMKIIKANTYKAIRKVKRKKLNCH